MRLKSINICLLSMLLIALISFSGCDVYNGKRPCDYPNTKWVCQEPQAIISVDEKGLTLCTVGSGEDEQEYDVLFTYGDEVIFSEMTTGTRSSKDFVFSGECNFGPEKMTVRVHADEDQLFHGEYQELVFIREH